MKLETLDKINKDIWIISDTHFGHKNVLDFEPGRLTKMRIDGYNADEHDQWLIDSWNKKVKPEDTVLHLGDVAFKRVKETISKLNGNIILILGNHDDSKSKTKYQDIEVIDGFFYKDKGDLVNKVCNNDLSAFIINIDNKKILFSHYALFNNDERDLKNKFIAPKIELLEKLYTIHNCDYNIHGHLHSSKSSFKNSINVSMENIGYEPIKLGELVNTLL